MFRRIFLRKRFRKILIYQIQKGISTETILQRLRRNNTPNTSDITAKVVELQIANQ